MIEWHLLLENKFKLDYNTQSSINFFNTNNKYYIIGLNKNQIQILSLDESLNYTAISKTFESSRVTNSIDTLLLAMYGNTFIVAETGPIKSDQNLTSFNIIFHKLSQDFESESWESFDTNNGPAFAHEISWTNSSTGFTFESFSIMLLI